MLLTLEIQHRYTIKRWVYIRDDLKAGVWWHVVKLRELWEVVEGEVQGEGGCGGVVSRDEGQE